MWKNLSWEKTTEELPYDQKLIIIVWLQSLCHDWINNLQLHSAILKLVTINLSHTNLQVSKIMKHKWVNISI